MSLAASEQFWTGTEFTDILLFLEPSIIVIHFLVLLRGVLRLSVILLLGTSLQFKALRGGRHHAILLLCKESMLLLLLLLLLTLFHLSLLLM